MFKTTGTVDVHCTGLVSQGNACRRRIFMLLKQLDESAATRRELLLQLVHLDSQAGSVQQECNTSQPLVAQIPDNDPDRRRPISLVSKRRRLDELVITRRELLSQLVDLDAKTSIAQLEHNSLYNLDAPISNLPDDVLAMIFEEGMHPRDLTCHFGLLVSHVTRRWRDVAISTPKLWNSIRCIGQWSDPYLERASATDESAIGTSATDASTTGRASNFLSRARSSPVDIYVEGFLDSDFTKFMQLFSDHIGHCRQIRIVGSDGDGITRVLKCISSRSTPLLVSIDLGANGRWLTFREQLFPLGAPRLTTARIDQIEIQTIHLCLPAFESLTSLQLTSLWVRCMNTGYGLLRAALMAMPSLLHLELFVDASFIDVRSSPPPLPIILPKIQHLLVEGSDRPFNLSNILRFIHAASLVTLSHSLWYDEKPLPRHFNLELHFPSLRHLILTNVTSDVPDLIWFARNFPDIDRLSFKPGSHENTLQHNIIHILSTILYGPDDDDRAEDHAHGRLLWPKLHSIATSTSRDHFDVARLKGTILKLQAAGHPIRKLMVPQELHPDMVEMKDAIEVEEFYIDWPTPFEW